jgi:UPF0716 protein FxsA
MPFIPLLLLLPVIEIALFILIGGRIGVLATVALVLLAGIAGVSLMRSAGADAAGRLRQSIAQQSDPSAAIVRGLMRFVAGMLLFLPGFLTDIAALVLLIPQVQAAAFAALRRRARMAGMVVEVATEAAERRRRPADRVIEGDYRDVTDTPDGHRPRSRWSDGD